MRNTIWNIIKKECRRFFGDRRMVFTVILLPAISLYALYSLMGSGMDSFISVEEDYAPRCYVQNMPEAFQPAFDEMGCEIVDVTDVEAAKGAVAEEKTDLLVLFPEDFDQKVQQSLETGEAPNVEVYYNSNAMKSLAAYDLFVSVADQFESSIANVLDVNRGVEKADLAKSSSLITSMLPLLVVSILFAGCASIGPESIAGEKERGTVATLLVTPVSRTAIAIGKISSLSLFALLAGLSSFIGLMLSLPKMFGEGFDMNVYGLREYAGLLCVIVTMVLLMVALTAVVSAYAKSVKEATSAVTMLTLLSTLAGLVPMFASTFSGIGWSCVPILGGILNLNDIFRLEHSSVNIAATCITNLVYTAGLVVVLSKMFNSEKIMFKK